MRAGWQGVYVAATTVSSLWAVLIAVFLLRLTGQGLVRHIALTARAALIPAATLAGVGDAVGKSPGCPAYRIRAMLGGIMVLGTALGPGLTGAPIDAGIKYERQGG